MPTAVRALHDGVRARPRADGGGGRPCLAPESRSWAPPAPSARSCARCWPSASSRSTSWSACASPRSAGTRVAFGDEEVEVQRRRGRGLRGRRHRDLLRRRDPLARVGADRHRARRRRRRQLVGVPHAGRRAAGRGRREPEALRDHRGLVANPNCSTMQLMPVLKPILDDAGLEHVTVSTYQSVSGTGQTAIDGLHDEARSALAGDAAAAAVYAAPIAFNVLPLAGSFSGDDGYTDEELKLVNETRKILELPDLRVSVTCVRVPVVTGHSEAVWVETREPLVARASCASCSRRAPGIVVVDDPASNAVPDGARCRRQRRRVRRPHPPRPGPPQRPRASGSSPTTCARARPRTPCRSPQLLVRDDLLAGARALAGRRLGAASARRPLAAGARATAARRGASARLVVADRHDAAQLQAHQLDAARPCAACGSRSRDRKSRGKTVRWRRKRAPEAPRPPRSGRRTPRWRRARRPAPRRCRPGTGSAAPTASRPRPGTST